MICLRFFATTKTAWYESYSKKTLARNLFSGLMIEDHSDDTSAGPCIHLRNTPTKLEDPRVESALPQHTSSLARAPAQGVGMPFSQGSRGVGRNSRQCEISERVRSQSNVACGGTYRASNLCAAAAGVVGSNVRALRGRERRVFTGRPSGQLPILLD